MSLSSILRLRGTCALAISAATPLIYTCVRNWLCGTEREEAKLRGCRLCLALARLVFKCPPPPLPCPHGESERERDSLSPIQLVANLKPKSACFLKGFFPGLM